MKFKSIHSELPDQKNEEKRILHSDGPITKACAMMFIPNVQPSDRLDTLVRALVFGDVFTSLA